MGKLKKKVMMRMLSPLVSGGVAWVAGIAADRMLHAGLRRAGSEKRKGTLARSAATAALAGTAELLAVQGTQYLLTRVTGKKKKKH